jgi:cell division initiation protein
VKLSPLEIRKQSFRSTMRGFDREEVQIFLDMIADEYEKVLQENGMLSEKIRYLNERLEEYHTLEKTLQNSILMAERVSSESREQARVDAENVINDANVRAERILGDSRNRLRQLGEQVVHLSQHKNAFVQKFQALLDAQSQFLLTHREDFNTIDELASQTSDLIDETAPDFISAEFDRDDYAEEDVDPGENIAEEQVKGDFETAPTELERDVAAEPVTSAAESPAYDGPRINREMATPGATSIMDPEAAGDKKAQQPGFFTPEERREGFFELNAEEGAQK